MPDLDRAVASPHLPSQLPLGLPIVNRDNILFPLFASLTQVPGVPLFTGDRESSGIWSQTRGPRFSQLEDPTAVEAQLEGMVGLTRDHSSCTSEAALGQASTVPPKLYTLEVPRGNH